MNFLIKNLSLYFNKIKDNKAVSIFLVQTCFYPRLMFSPADALYSINFIKVLIKLRVPNINIINIFAQILKYIVPNIHCCTNNESENLGIFFMEWFKMMERMTDADIWKKECADYSGFATKVGINENNFEEK